jgi:alpha-L-rhamnosidase
LLRRSFSAPNTTATVFIPATKSTDVTVDGKPTKDEKYVNFLRMENGRAVFQVSAGLFRFTSTVSASFK